jgi:hypothetical protein
MTEFNEGSPNDQVMGDALLTRLPILKASVSP